ncbi:hypothetical protein FNH43_21760 [Salmonella enterica subsp. salamae]|nr:hypothetical protein [Salmonella enterica subsp. salamae]
MQPASGTVATDDAGAFGHHAGFFSERGLTLSEEKTTIVSISQKFDFLGFHIRKYGKELLFKTAKAT